MAIIRILEETILKYLQLLSDVEDVDFMNLVRIFYLRYKIPIKKSLMDEKLPDK